MRVILSLLITVLVVLLAIFLGVILLIGWASGIGWLVTRVLPFTLFEASLLVMVASAIVGLVGWRILSIRVPLPGDEEDEDEYEDEDEEYPIPDSRFYNSAADKTEEAWFRYRMANDILIDIQNDPQVKRLMAGKQLEELAIRLTDIIVAALKQKTRHGRRVSVTLELVKKQMEKMGQKPYDEDILQTAVMCANQQLFFDEELADIVREKRWGELTDW